MARWFFGSKRAPAVLVVLLAILALAAWKGAATSEPRGRAVHGSILRDDTLAMPAAASGLNTKRLEAYLRTAEAADLGRNPFASFARETGSRASIASAAPVHVVPPVSLAEDSVR